MAQKEFPVKDYTKDYERANEERNSGNSSGFIVGAVVGGVIGACCALFMAPKTGKELRSDVTEQAKSISQKTEKLRRVAIEKGNGIAETAKEKSSSVTQLVSDKGSDLLDKVSSLKPGVKTGEELSKKEGIESLADDKGSFGHRSKIKSVEVKHVPDAEKSTAKDPKKGNKSAAQLLDETEKAFEETETKYKQ
ncbi:YtxH domain-containing protein [Peribacillus sp. NPDC096379]|uniref:YtxH domain-containing protein n=1 Tax=Peribacillus sp. NPDC096379 TaxID=3364393 RepID=UPI003827F88D